MLFYILTPKIFLSDLQMLYFIDNFIPCPDFSFYAHPTTFIELDIHRQ